MTTPHEGMAPFDAVLDRYFKERLTALLSDPATVDNGSKKAIATHGELLTDLFVLVPSDCIADDRRKAAEGFIRAITSTALQAIKEVANA